MTKVKSSNRIETKLDIHSWDISKSGITFLWSNNRIEAKLDIRSWDISKSGITFLWSQNTKAFQLLLYLASFSFIVKVSANKKKKKN